MAKLPDVTALGARPTPQPAASMGGFGALSRGAGALAQAQMDSGMEGFQRAGQAFSKAFERIQAREDAVELARTISAYNEESASELMRIQTEEDLSPIDAGKKYSSTRLDSMKKHLEGFRGSENARAHLESRLEGIRSEYVSKAVATSVEAQRKKVDGVIGEQINQFAAKARSDPTQLPALYEMARSSLAEFSPALTPDEENMKLRTAQSAILEGAFEGVLDRGNVAEAEKILLDTPGADKLLTVSARNRLYERIRSARAEQRAKKGEGFTLAPGQVRFDEAGRPVAAVPRDPKEIQGTEWERLRDSFAINTPLLASGNLTPRQEQIFVADIINYIQPQQRENPFTGKPEWVRNMIPGYVADALEARGYKVPKEAISDVTRLTQADTGRPAETVSPTPERQKAEAKPSIYEQADLITGPVGVVGEAVGKIPGTPGLTPEITSARQYVTTVQNDLVRVLQNSPKYAEGERESIKNEINIAGKLFDNPGAFRQRIVGLDDALETRYQNALKTAQSDKVGREERVHAMNVANAIMNFRASLIPPRFDSPDDAKQWATDKPPGTPFLARTGKGEYQLRRTGK